MKTQFQKKAGSRWTWRSPDGHTKNEIDYIMTDEPSMVTEVTVINRINIGSDHTMVMGSIKLNTRLERRKLLNKNTRTRVDTDSCEWNDEEHVSTRTEKQVHNMTEMTQQRAMSIANQTKKQKKPNISSPTRALMRKRRDIIEN